MDNQINEEKIFFLENNVLVSQYRLVIRDKTYVLRNISSVSTASDSWINKPNKTKYKIFIGIAAALLYGRIKSISLHRLFESEHVIPFFSYIIIAICIVVIIFSIYKMSKLKTQYFFSYSVRISSNSGTSDVLSSSDKQYIQRIVDAINQAIIYQG